jgi:D-tyrosyl-tRNA(Tyr) deacylase
MRLLIQCVKEAQVVVEGALIGKIGKGILVFLGIHKDDTRQDCLYLKEKILALRIFKDKEEKMNLSLQEIGGEILIVSQFTLYADCTKGRRPSFTEAAPPKVAKDLYDYFIDEMKKAFPNLQTGLFGAHMEVKLVNDGPLTFLLETSKAN